MTLTPQSQSAPTPNDMTAELYIGHGKVELEFESKEDQDSFLKINHNHPGFEIVTERRLLVLPQEFEIGRVWRIQFLPRP